MFSKEDSNGYQFYHRYAKRGLELTCIYMHHPQRSVKAQ